MAELETKAVEPPPTGTSWDTLLSAEASVLHAATVVGVTSSEDNELVAAELVAVADVK